MANFYVSTLEKGSSSKRLIHLHARIMTFDRATEFFNGSPEEVETMIKARTLKASFWKTSDLEECKKGCSFIEDILVPELNKLLEKTMEAGSSENVDFKTVMERLKITPEMNTRIRCFLVFSAQAIVPYLDNGATDVEEPIATTEAAPEVDQKVALLASLQARVDELNNLTYHTGTCTTAREFYTKNEAIIEILMTVSEKKTLSDAFDCLKNALAEFAVGGTFTEKVLTFRYQAGFVYQQLALEFVEGDKMTVKKFTNIFLSFDILLNPRMDVKTGFWYKYMNGTGLYKDGSNTYDQIELFQFFVRKTSSALDDYVRILLARLSVNFEESQSAQDISSLLSQVKDQFFAAKSGKQAAKMTALEKAEQVEGSVRGDKSIRSVLSLLNQWIPRADADRFCIGLSEDDREVLIAVVRSMYRGLVDDAFRQGILEAITKFGTGVKVRTPEATYTDAPGRQFTDYHALFDEILGVVNGLDNGINKKNFIRHDCSESLTTIVERAFFGYQPCVLMSMITFMSTRVTVENLPRLITGAPGKIIHNLNLLRLLKFDFNNEICRSDAFHMKLYGPQMKGTVFFTSDHCKGNQVPLFVTLTQSVMKDRVRDQSIIERENPFTIAISTVPSGTAWNAVVKTVTPSWGDLMEIQKKELVEKSIKKETKACLDVPKVSTDSMTADQIYALVEERRKKTVKPSMLSLMRQLKNDQRREKEKDDESMPYKVLSEYLIEIGVSEQEYFKIGEHLTDDTEDATEVQKEITAMIVRASSTEDKRRDLLKLGIQNRVLQRIVGNTPADQTALETICKTFRFTDVEDIKNWIEANRAHEIVKTVTNSERKAIAKKERASQVIVQASNLVGGGSTKAAEMVTVSLKKPSSNAGKAVRLTEKRVLTLNDLITATEILSQPVQESTIRKAFLDLCDAALGKLKIDLDGLIPIKKQLMELNLTEDEKEYMKISVTDGLQEILSMDIEVLESTQKIVNEIKSIAGIIYNTSVIKSDCLLSVCERLQQTGDLTLIKQFLPNQLNQFAVREECLQFYVDCLKIGNSGSFGTACEYREDIMIVKSNITSLKITKQELSVIKPHVLTIVDRLIEVEYDAFESYVFRMMEADFHELLTLKMLSVYHCSLFDSSSVKSFDEFLTSSVSSCSAYFRYGGIDLIGNVIDDFVQMCKAHMTEEKIVEEIVTRGKMSVKTSRKIALVGYDFESIVMHVLNNMMSSWSYTPSELWILYMDAPEKLVETQYHWILESQFHEPMRQLLRPHMTSDRTIISKEIAHEIANSILCLVAQMSQEGMIDLNHLGDSMPMIPEGPTKDKIVMEIQDMTGLVRVA